MNQVVGPSTRCVFGVTFLTRLPLNAHDAIPKTQIESKAPAKCLFL